MLAGSRRQDETGRRWAITVLAELGLVLLPKTGRRNVIDDHQYLLRAIQLAEQCPPTTNAFSVGAIIVDEEGNEISHGYSRESDPVIHAEESALAKLAPADPRLPTAILYSSLNHVPNANHDRGPAPSSSSTAESSESSSPGENPTTTSPTLRATPTSPTQD